MNQHNQLKAVWSRQVIWTLATLVVIALSSSLVSTVSAQALKEAPVEASAKPTPKQATAKTSKKKEESAYLRILRNKDDEPVAMQTSIVSFRHREDDEAADSSDRGIVVDLIGAVHVADKGYFRKLNQAFTKYDALLYELVAPEEANVPDGGRSQHPVGQMQQGMKSMLQLAYQLEEINYRKRNFVHADMSPAEFDRVMTERDESWLKMMFKMMGAAIAGQGANGKSNDADLLFALFAGRDERALRLKRVMSTQFGDLESTMGVLEGEKGSTIIGMRNKKALDVLDRELQRGKKRVAIFYGAGHLPDMEERLAKRFGMYPDKKNVKWLTAWDMSD